MSRPCASKIERSFIADVSSNSDDAAITEAIISMAHSLQLKVIAEGVESEEQLRFLELRNCDEVQGYYLGSPMPVQDMVGQLATPERRNALMGLRKEPLSSGPLLLNRLRGFPYAEANC